MPLPDVIPIAYEPDFRTDTIGTYADGQFFASVTGARRDEIDRWYAVLHLFDHDGRHQSSKIQLLGIGNFGEERAAQEITKANRRTRRGSLRGTGTGADSSNEAAASHHGG
jgi:hypothetical protein